jgi:hypothetical protein
MPTPLPRLSLTLLPDELAVARLQPESELPSWAERRGRLWSITRTREEVSIVCAESEIPPDVTAERGFRALAVAGPIAFSATGVLASLALPLWQAGVSLFALSTYDTDYILITGGQIERALEALASAGHTVHAAKETRAVG